MINRSIFFQYAQRNPFAGRIAPQQKDGLTRILARWDELGLKDTRWLAYILATVFHETAATMQPVTERGTKKYLESKPYYPYIGQGLVQITWKENYDKFGVDLGDPLDWHTSLDILFKGMIQGMFTGKKLQTFFNSKREDPRGARAIINGADKAGLIADYYTAFKGAIDKASEKDREAPPEAEEIGQATPLLGDTSVQAVAGSVASTGLLGTLISYVDSIWGVAIIGLIGVFSVGGFWIYLRERRKEKYELGV